MTQPPTEAEFRYSLLSWLLDGPEVVIIDNLRERLDSSTLASVLTDHTFQERRVRTSETSRVNVEATFIGTGNNPSLSTEIARRTVRIRLDSQMQDPDMRKGFRHPDLKQWVRQNRSELIWATLTLIQAWVAAGMPAGRAAPMGSFENWSWIIGGILETVGVKGFLENRSELRLMADTETASLLPFFDAWFGRFNSNPVGVADLWSIAGDLDLGTGDEQSRKIRLGKRLDALRDCWFGPHRIVKLGLTYRGAQRYRLERGGDGRLN